MQFTIPQPRPFTINELKRLLRLPDEADDPVSRSERSAVSFAIATLTAIQEQELLFGVDLDSLPNWSRNIFHLRNKTMP
jgi:hypothetical protein